MVDSIDRGEETRSPQMRERKASTVTRHPFESEFLYGIHDAHKEERYGRNLMDDAGRKGWVVFSTEAAFGHSPEIELVVNEGFKIMVRLNYD